MLRLPIRGGQVQQVLDPSHCLDDIVVKEDGIISALVVGMGGWHTVFVRVKNDEWNGWLPADFHITWPKKLTPVIPVQPTVEFEPVDISSHFNCDLTGIHRQEYRNPRPEGYSIGMKLNGRYGWDWNHGGHNAVIVDDQKLRECGGLFRIPSGVPFSTPADGPNVACVSLWDNYPDEISFVLSGNGNELAIFLIGITNPMQSRIENARLVLEYEDGAPKIVSLVPPVNFDDWLNAACQEENEAVYFSDFNHGMIVRLPLEPSQRLARLLVRASAYEVVVGVLGVSVRRRSI
jgi:hypothetical protein